RSTPDSIDAPRARLRLTSIPTPSTRALRSMLSLFVRGATEGLRWGNGGGIDPIRRMRPPSVVFDHSSSLIYRANAQVAILPDEAARPGQVSLRWLETFIEPERFAGTCYRAANWQCWRRSAMELKTTANPQMRPRELRELWFPSRRPLP